MPLGPGEGTASYEGRLHLAFRYRSALWGARAAARFADLFEAELAAALA